MGTGLSVLERYVSKPKVAGLSPSSGSEPAFRSGLLFAECSTAVGSSDPFWLTLCCVTWVTHSL
jgi:hypothetical protein